jgi:predicted ATPase
MNISSIKSIYFDIDEPIKLDKLTLTQNKITVYIGANGSGKSFIMINLFCIQTLLGSLFMSGKDISDPVKRTLAQDIWDSSFDDQNINGVIEGEWGYVSIRITFVKGDVIKVEHTDLSIITDVAPVIYMSSHMRTFNAISMYLKMRKNLKESCQPTHALSEELLLKLKSLFKLYDIIYIEGIITKIPIHLSKESKDRLLVFDTSFLEFDKIDVDFENCDFIITKSNGDVIKASTLPKGHQSILNMFLPTAN